MRLSYELRLGVTGHRTVPNHAGVAASIGALLARMSATLGSPNTPLACTVISPLAAGADRLVAQAAMATLRARLEVVTPFQIADYRVDFESGADRAEFDALLGQAAIVDELPGTASGQASAALPHEQLRDAAYHRVGERVVDACEILIAVWNGRRAGGTGGTADIIEHALRRERLVIWIHAERPDSPPVVVRRISFNGRGDDAVVDTVEVPANARELSPGYHQQASYFADRGVSERKRQAGVADVGARVAAAAKAAGIPEDALGGVVQAIVPEFVRADALALRYQRRHVLVVNGILRLAAGAVTVALAQVLLFPSMLWLIGLEILAMLAVLALWLGSRRGAWHEKWLHDRFLAEQLRAAMFTVVIGAARQGEAPDARLAFYRGPKDWLTRTGAALAERARTAVSPLPLEPMRRLLVDGWLRDQERFHERNAERKAHQAHRRHQLGLALFGGTLLMATLHFFHVADLDIGGRPWLNPSLWITFFALVFPVWAGVVHAITTQLELERVAERSWRMATTLAGLADRMERALTPEELAEGAREASALMLGETHEWWVLLSFQDVKLHV